MPIPLWAIALVLAAVAPLTVKTVARALEAKRRSRTEALLTRASRAELEREKGQE